MKGLVVDEFSNTDSKRETIADSKREIIADGKRDTIPRIAKRLGYSQKEIAARLGISATALSRFLSTGPERINLRPRHQERLMALLGERLTECRTIKSLDQKDLAARVADNPSDKDLVDAALALSPETVKALEHEISELSSGEPMFGSAPPGPSISSPGGALPVHAVNYVRRAADSEIADILIQGSAAASAVVAPINGGTSSFLNRVYQKAQEMRDCLACIAHLDAAFVKDEPFTQLDLFKFLFREIGVPDDVLAAEHRDVSEMKAAFDRWARTAWKDANRIVLVIDGLDQIFASAGALTDALAVTNWLTGLRNEASHGEPPYKNLVLCVAFSGKTWSAAHASPYASQAGSLELNKFTVSQVAQVFEQLGVADQTQLEEVHRLFHGHPYLTQLFAWSMRAGASRQEARAGALDLESRYEAHWERMKTEIEFMIGRNFGLRKVLATTMKAAGHPSQQTLDDAEDELWRAYRRNLRVLGLVDGSRDAPTICEFYRAAIKRELS